MSLWWMKGRERESKREREKADPASPPPPPRFLVFSFSRFSLALPKNPSFCTGLSFTWPRRSPGAQRYTCSRLLPKDQTTAGLASALTGCLIQSSHLVESERWESQSTLHPDPSMQPDSQRHGTYTPQRCRVTAEDALSCSFQQDRHNPAGWHVWKEPAWFH